MLSSLVRAAGFQQVEVIPYAIDYGASSEHASAWYRSMLVLFKLMEPFFLKTGAFTPEAWEEVYHQAEAEMLAPDFQAVWTVHTVWGRREGKRPDLLH